MSWRGGAQKRTPTEQSRTRFFPTGSAVGAGAFRRISGAPCGALDTDPAAGFPSGALSSEPADGRASRLFYSAHDHLSTGEVPSQGLKAPLFLAFKVHALLLEAARVRAFASHRVDHLRKLYPRLNQIRAMTNLSVPRLKRNPVRRLHGRGCSARRS